MYRKQYVYYSDTETSEVSRINLNGSSYQSLADTQHVGRLIYQSGSLDNFAKILKFCDLVIYLAPAICEYL